MFKEELFTELFHCGVTCSTERNSSVQAFSLSTLLLTFLLHVSLKWWTWSTSRLTELYVKQNVMKHVVTAWSWASNGNNPGIINYKLCFMQVLTGQYQIFLLLLFFYSQCQTVSDLFSCSMLPSVFSSLTIIHICADLPCVVDNHCWGWREFCGMGTFWNAVHFYEHKTSF